MVIKGMLKQIFVPSWYEEVRNLVYPYLSRLVFEDM